MELLSSLSPINPEWKRTSHVLGSPIVYSRARKPLGESSSVNIKQDVPLAAPAKVHVVTHTPQKKADAISEPLGSDVWDEFDRVYDDEEEFSSPEQAVKEADDACWDYYEAAAQESGSKLYGASLLAMYIFTVVAAVIAVLYPSAPMASNAPLALAAPTLARQHSEHLKELLTGSSWHF